MKDINKVILLGRLGAHPIRRSTKTGICVAHFSLATSKRIQKDEQLPEGAAPTFIEETQWHRVVVWGKLGESCVQFLRKGDPVYVEGGLKHRSYQDKEGKEKHITEVHVENISFLKTRITPSPDLTETADSLVQSSAALGA